MLTRRITMPFIVRDGGDPAGGDPAPPTPPAPPAPADPPAPPAPDDSAFARLRREKEAAEREAEQARNALAEKERKEAEEQGRWKDLAEQEKARADQLAASMAAQEQQRSIETQARALRFRDPDIVVHLLPNGVDRNDSTAVQAALAAVAEQRPHLIDTGTPPPAPPSGGPPGGNPPDPPGLTAEQIRAMSPQQVAALDPEVLNKALAS